QQQLKIEISANLPPLKTHLPSLERIVTELLNNACKYTQSGETITISAQSCAMPLLDNSLNTLPTVSETASGWGKVRDRSPALSVDGPPPLLLQVSNTGVEIPAEECDRIFEKFYRIPQNDPWKHGGTGLGLAMVKKLSQELGAEISVRSGDNQTTFTLRFPP
ncbi:MAG TPA: ATP-binding protein, partial [Chroococcidiopsis sp.]